MTSHRKRKKQAQERGLSERELELVELLEEVLDTVKWLQVLGYSNQFALQQRLKLTAEERDRILEAAARAVERERPQHEWRERLARIKATTIETKRAMGRAQKQLARERRSTPRAEGGSGIDA